MRNVSIALDVDTARRLRMDAAHADKSVSAYVAGLLAAPVAGFGERGQAPYRAETPPATTKITLSLPTDLVARLRVDAARAGKSMSRHLADLVGAAPETRFKIPTPEEQKALDDFAIASRERFLAEKAGAPTEQGRPDVPKMTQAEALRLWLAGPPLNYSVNGKLPSRDELHDDD